MFRTLFAIGKTYVTVKAVEWVARAFRSRKAKTAKAPAKRAHPKRTRAHA